MSRRDIVVIGASAGGLQALQQIVRGFPADLEAAVFMALHISPDARSLLAEILTHCGRLPARHAVDNDPIRRGQILIAPPNRHLLIKGNKVHTVQGPKENGFRPAIDPLFRTAARAYGPRTVGVILSGGLDDGTQGMLTIKQHGGIAIAQDPTEAECPSMPQSAIDNVPIDHVLRGEQIGRQIVELVQQGSGEPMERSTASDRPDVAEGLTDPLRAEQLQTPPSPLGCPECGGPLWEHKEGQFLHYRCHVGHAYTANILLAKQDVELEQALWSAVRLLEENANLSRRMADSLKSNASEDMRSRFRNRAVEREQHANAIRSILISPSSYRPTSPNVDAAEIARRDYSE